MIDSVDGADDRGRDVQVGFIGLGRMGRGMAAKLLAADVPLLVYDTDPEAATPLLEGGAEWAGTVAEIARRCGVVFTSLPGPVQVEEVALGADGLLANARPGLTLIELSTSSLALARRIHAAFQERGASMLDAPISGGPAGAASGELVIWAGGDKAAFDRHLELLRVIADEPRHVGSVGAGTVTKLAHNLTGFMIMLTLAETFSLGVKAGVEPLELWSAMRLGLVGRRSPLDMLTAQFLPGRYDPPAFALELAHKDVTLATSLARELGVPMRLANLTLDEMTEALGRGFAQQDSRSFLKLQLERAGVEIAVDPEAISAAVEAARTSSVAAG
jgi:3-hydroxyisobutyrate dehydrogenase